MENFNNWINQNQDQILISIVGIISVAGYFFIINYFSNKAIVIRILQKQAKTAISSLQENKLAKVIGKAKPISEDLFAPLSGRKCVLYSVIVEQKTSGNNSHWREIIREENVHDFLLESYSGKAIIKMKNYKSYFVADAVYKSGHFKDPTMKLENYLYLHGKKSQDTFGFNKKLRYKEAIVEVDEKIAVMGTVKYENINQYGLSDIYSKIPILQSVEKNKLIISDDPKALIEKVV